MRRGAHRLGAALLTGTFLVCTTPAHAFSETGHVAIVDAALAHMPTDQQRGLRRHAEFARRGATERSGELHAEERVSTGPEQVLALIREDVARVRGLAGDPTPFLAYELGRLSADVSHLAEPFGLYGAGDAPPYRGRYEALLERRFLHATGVSASAKGAGQYADALDNAWRFATTLQATIRADEAQDFPPTSQSVRSAGDVAGRIVAAVVTVWLAAMEGESSLEQSDTMRLSLDQIAFGATHERWDEVRAGLVRMVDARLRVPLTRGNVPSAFFELGERGADCDLYALAVQVDRRSPRLRELADTCGRPVRDRSDKATSADAVASPGPSAQPDAEASGMRAFRHRRGHLHLTNRDQELGEDFVPLNFTPIARFSKPTQTQAPAELEDIVQYYADVYSVDASLVKAVIYAESDFDPHVVSRAGARGLMQLMPSTALDMGVEDIFDPAQNVAGGTQYLALLLERYHGDETLALAAYNAGPGTVDRYGGVPPYDETRKYIPKVLARQQQYASTGARVTLRGQTPRPSEDFLPAEPARQGGVLLVLKNGLTMRGLGAEETAQGVRLQIETGWILVPDRVITRVIRATS